MKHFKNVLAVFLSVAMLLTMGGVSTIMAGAESMNAESSSEIQGQSANNESTPETANEEYSSDLFYFVDNASLKKSDNTDVDTNKIRTDEDYQVILSFKEGTYQFSTNKPSTYTFPKGFQAVNTSGNFTLTLDRGNGEKISGEITWTVSNNVLTIYWPENLKDQINTSTNVQFQLTFNGKFDGNQTHFNFGQKSSYDINYDKPAYVEITKTPSYKPGTGIVTYTEELTSHGDNTNITIVDTITGAALKYNNDLSVSPSTVSIQTTNFNEKGFTASIPSMKNGEKATLTYTASLDLSKLTSANSQTLKQTGNKVTVTSKEDTTGDTKDSTVNVGTYTTISKSGALEGTNENGYQSIKWTVTANPEKKVPVKSITDTIPNNASVPMTVDTTKSVTLKINGTERDVNWSNFTVNESGWTYNPSESDGNASYEITYYTKADVRNIASDTEVSNDAKTDRANTTGKVTVHPKQDNTLGITKEFDKNDSTDTEAAWIIEIKVPGIGLNKDNATVTDTYPNTWKDNKHFYDKVSEVSVDGLKDNESYVLDNTTNADKATITFYKNKNHTDDNKGLDKSSNGEPRTIKIKLKTKYNQDWLKAMRQDPAGSSGYLGEHKNSASIGGKSTDEIKIPTEDLPTEKNISKNFKNKFDVTINGVTYPAFEFQLAIEGGLDENGFKIQDDFDTNLFKMYNPTPKENRPYNHNYFCLIDEKYQYMNNAPLLDISDTGKITVSADNVKTLKESGVNIDGKFFINYTLIPKDEEALNRLNNLAAQKGGTYNITNSASMGSLNTGKVSAPYTVTNITKECMNWENGNAIPNNKAHFKITANPNQYRMNDGKPVIVTDTLTNLSMDYTSVTAKIDGKTAENVTWNMSGSTIKFTIPDQKAVVIEYDATILAKGEVKNEADLSGQKSTFDNNYNVDVNNSGNGSMYRINILKYQDGDLTKPIKGVKFALYDSSNDNPMKYTEDSGTSKKDENVVVTTNSEGTAVLEDTAFYPHHKYYVKEISAPSGYAEDHTKYEFTFTEGSEAADYNKYLYFNNDTLKIANKPIDSLKITKQVEGGGTTASSKTYTFTVLGPDGFYYKPDGTNGNWKRSADPQDVEITGSGSVTLQNVPEGKYTITEKIEDAKIKGYTLSATPVNGVATAAVTKEQDTEAKITNTYIEAGKGSAVLSIKKAASGKGAPETIPSIFNFTVSAVTKNAPLPDRNKRTVTNNGDNVTFDPIVYTEEKPEGYIYKIEETGYADNATETQKKAWTKPENAVIYAKVTVSANKSNGLDTSVKYYSDKECKNENELTDEKIKITNTYEAAPVQVTISGTKAYNTAALRNNTNKKFSFTMQGTSENDKNQTYKDYVTGNGTNNQNFSFGQITYDKPGNYVYNVTEDDNSYGGFSKDGTVYTVTVNVTDNGTGQLQAKTYYKIGEESKKGISFTNNYSTTSTTYTPNVLKRITGLPSGITSGKTFRFNLKQDGSDYTDTTTVKGEGQGSFKTITYDKTGEYTYEIRENEGDDNGYSYSTAKIKLNVTVTDVNGALKATAKYGDDKDAISAVFTNTYKAAPVSVTVNGTKSYDTSALPKSDGKVFTFTMKGTKGDRQSYTAKVTGDGTNNQSFEFPPITYNAAGTYTYTVKEDDIDSSYSGFSKDDTVYKVIVKVTDNGSGQLKASTEIKKGDTAAPDGIIFTNTYKEENPAPRKASIELRKVNASHTSTAVPKATYGIYRVFDEKAKDVTTVQDAKKILENENNCSAYPDISNNRQTTSDSDGSISFTDLDTGTYIIREEEAPGNYIKTEDPVVLKVDETEDGGTKISSVKTSEGKAAYSKNAGVLTWYEEETDKSVTISKQDIAGKEIAGAKLTVVDENGNTIDEWISKKDESHTIKVKSGKYSLKEIATPDGYKKANDIGFTVSVDGKITVDDKDVNAKVVMIDDYQNHEVTISKQDIGGKEIEGAKLKVTDKSGKEIEHWTSEEGKDHKLSLQPGAYTLTEITAPEGYEKAESIKFVVNKDGKVTVDDEDVNAKIVMIDEYQKHEVTISKQDVGGKEIAGAELRVTDESGKEIDSWTSEALKSHKISVKPGTYTLTEITAPEGYEKAESIKFTVDKDGNVTVDGKDVKGKVIMVDRQMDRSDKKHTQTGNGKSPKTGESSEAGILSISMLLGAIALLLKRIRNSEQDRK